MPQDRKTMRERRVALYKIGRLIIEGSGRNLDQTVELNELIHNNFEWISPKLISIWFPVIKARNTEGGVQNRKRIL